MKPTTMLYRNLMAMDVEESIRAYPLDGVVLLTGCDKTNPASIMGAASADIPAIVVTGGPMLNGHWRGRRDRLVQRLLALPRGAPGGAHHRGGVGGDRELDVALERPLHDHGDGVDDGVRDRGARADSSGRRRYPGSGLAPTPARRGCRAGRSSSSSSADLKPSDILTREAFENAIRVLHAISGSTNAILHCIAYAGRVGVDLPLQLFDDLCATTPWLVDLKPGRRFLMEDFFYAGGVPAVMAQIADLLHLDAITVTRSDGRREHRRCRDRQPRGHPALPTSLSTRGGALVVLHGSLCPDGAVMKITRRRSAAAPARGPSDRVRGHPRPRRPRRRPRPRRATRRA